ncbi:4772_t:CDS:2 [Entrophospora sp. SA101]|nr:4772_t:CDS:2 [Entrophospora sp. SA101]
MNYPLWENIKYNVELCYGGVNEVMILDIIKSQFSMNKIGCIKEACIKIENFIKSDTYDE